MSYLTRYFKTSLYWKSTLRTQHLSHFTYYLYSSHQICEQYRWSLIKTSCHHRQSSE